MKKILCKKNIFILFAIILIFLVTIMIITKLRPTDNQIENNLTENVEGNLDHDNLESNSEEENKDLNHADMLDEISKNEDTGEQIFFINKSDVRSFSLTDSNGILLDFEKEGNEWICSGYEDLNLDEDRVDNILNYICDIRFIESYESNDGSEYGLTTESKMFIVEDFGGNNVLVSIGNVDENDGGVYFAINYDYTTIFKNSGKLKNVCDYGIEELIKL